MMVHRSFMQALTLFAAVAAAPNVHACPDLDGSGDAGFADLTLILTSWGPCARGPVCTADLDGSGDVGFGDITLLLLGWGSCIETGVFPEEWIYGALNCSINPGAVAIQVHAYNDDLYILRQSLCTNFEGPFMYLIFGEDKVLMQDTGAGNIPIGQTVKDLITQWLAANGRTSIQLIVSHSHSHGDHVQGDSQFVGQPNTTVVGLSVSQVSNFFGITSWPTQIVEYDLGDRIIDVIPIPGHHPAHIALYDRRTGLVFTGDTLYPGRLYISDFAAYQASLHRLTGFLEGQPIEWVLGTHIEMTNTPGDDFPFGSTYHPNEHELELEWEHLIELQGAVDAMAPAPHIEPHDDFIVWPF